ncbi:hypothetical protein [Schaalia sp. Marseille-Q2122]|uniref:hypothetical protein n=1 Tax=Schaalia sp. Marseille-Q2122 TaxID=2736604 RepID=UPI00158CA2FF|nr:hypothetical protein [Schaalia sp. Marseille-Q2122]
MTNMPSVRHSSQHFLIFTTDADSSIEVRYEDGTIWLTQKALAELFDVDVRTINEHLLNIYDSGELPSDRTIRNFRIVRSDQHALAQYAAFREQQDHNYVSDYDRFADEAVKALEQRHP